MRFPISPVVESGKNGFGLVISALIIVLLVVVILKLTGHLK
jgi:hypothetical protein